MLALNCECVCILICTNISKSVADNSVLKNNKNEEICTVSKVKLDFLKMTKQSL